MERFLQHYSQEHKKMANKEYMRLAMLKHEEIFKEQVIELHRLYRVQKMLTKDLKRQHNPSYYRQNKTDSTQLHHRPQNLGTSYRTLDLERPTEEQIVPDNDGHVMGEIVRESDIELTLATGGSGRRKKEQVSLTSDSGTSYSSSSTGSGGEILKLHEWGLLQTPTDINMSCPVERSGVNVEEGMRQDRLKQPSWHLQCLSLKMT